MQTQIFHLQNLSALHVGTGQGVGVGVVDLPIARSKSTNLPLVMVRLSKAYYVMSWQPKA